MNSFVHVVIFGGTGFVGSRICNVLRSRDIDVTAVARSPPEEDLPPGVEFMAGDVTDPSTLPSPLSNADVAVNLVALSPLRRPRGGEKMHDRVHRQGTENIVHEALNQGVDQMVQMSGIHADPNGPTHYLRAKGKAELIVRDEIPEWIIFRPTVLFGEGSEFEPFVRRVALPYLTPLPGGGKGLFQPLWVNDIAEMIVEAIVDDEHTENTYEVGGPDRYSLAEIAALIHEAHGRSTNILPIPMPIAGLGMSLGAFIPGFPFGPDQYRGLQIDLITEENDVSVFTDPSRLTSFESYLSLG